MRFPLLFGACLALVGCGRGGFSSRSVAQSAGTLRNALASNITTLDPGKVQDIEYIDLLSNVFEGLVAYDEKNQIVGRLAESWSVTNGGRTYVFRLRPGARFSNGREVTAEDVKWSLERNASPALNSPTAGNYLSDIVGVRERLAGKTKRISGIRVLDPRTVAIDIDRPRAYFLGKLTYPTAFVLAKEAVGPGPIERAEQAVGTGPFRMARVLPAQEIDLEANKGYYLGAPKLARIVRPILLDAATRLNQYRAGALDLLTLPRQDVAAAQADPVLSRQLSFQLRPAVFYLLLHEKTFSPFADPRVRIALASAIDRARIANEVLGGYPEAKTFLPPGILGYRPNYPGLPYDPAKGRRLLAQAGYPGGRGLPPIELALRAQTPDASRATEAIAIQLAENLGVRVRPRAFEWATLLDQRNKDRLQMAFQSWYADYLDPQNFLSFLLRSDSPLNHDGFASPEFDALTARADVATDPAERARLYQRAEDIIVLQAVRIPLYFQRDAILVSPRVSGLRSNLFGNLPHLTTSVNAGAR